MSWLKPSLYFAFLLFCNVVIPCLLFYLLRIYTHVSTKELIGISSAALGISSCFDAPFRLYRLIKFHNKYGPLNDAKWYHLDFTMWVYTLALLVFAFPLAIAPAIPVYNFFLLSTAMLVAPVGIVFFIMLKSWRVKCWLSSDCPGKPTKPAVYYILEDVVAVDFGYGREWRLALHNRYEASPVFRALMQNLTLYWALMSVVYVGATCAVTWSTTLQNSFGIVLGDFFIWAILAGFGSYFLAKAGLAKERKAWEQTHAVVEQERATDGTPKWLGGGQDEEKRDGAAGRVVGANPSCSGSEGAA